MYAKKRKNKDARLHQAEIARRHANALRKAEQIASLQFEVGSVQWRAAVDKLLKELGGD